MATNRPQDNWGDAIESTATRNRVLRFVDDLFAALPATWEGRSLLNGSGGLQIKMQDTESGRVMVIDMPLDPQSSPADINAAARAWLASQSKDRDFYTVS